MTTLTEATAEQLDAELATRRKAEIVTATATQKDAVDTYVSDSCPKGKAAGFVIADEESDPLYVTIRLPGSLPDTGSLPDNWTLIRKAMDGDDELHAIDGSGVLRIHQARAEAVLDFIEANIPEE